MCFVRPLRNPKIIGKIRRSRLVGGTWLVVFPHFLIPCKLKKTTSRDPYPPPFKPGPSPLLHLWEGARGKGPRLERGSRSCRFFGQLYTGILWQTKAREFTLNSSGVGEAKFQLFGGSQKGGFQKGGFGGCSPGTKTGTRVRSPKPPFWKPPFYLPKTLFGVDKRVVSKRVVSADVPPERKPERGYIRHWTQAELVRQNFSFLSPCRSRTLPG